MIKILDKSNSCSKIKGKNSKKPRKSMSTIWIINAKWESSSKINSSSLKISSVAKKSSSPNSNSKSITSSIKTKTSSSKTNDLKGNSAEWKKSTAAKSTNWKPPSAWKLVTFKKLLSNTTPSSKSSRKKANNTSSNLPLSLKGKLRTLKRNWKPRKMLKE